MADNVGVVFIIRCTVVYEAEVATKAWGMLPNACVTMIVIFISFSVESVAVYAIKRNVVAQVDGAENSSCSIRAFLEADSIDFRRDYAAIVDVVHVF